MNQLTLEQKLQFNEILENLGQTLDITEDQHDAAVKSYEFVGNWLSDDESPLAPYTPEILPQGSFMLGTMIKPVNEDDDLDIDLVCRLEGKQRDWTQSHLKMIVGDRLADHGTLKKLLELPDGRRCWTLKYADSAKFHMDILPSVTDSGYRILMESMFNDNGQDYENLAIRITDKYEENYRTETLPESWPKSNPFGYGIWFESRAQIEGRETTILSEAVQPVPKYQPNKLPLQRIVQILKRHRDIMFQGDEDKPISIIITTLSARAYRQEIDIYEGLTNVLEAIPDFIEERYSEKHGRMIKWIPNPVNPEENFADKWPEKPKKEENFYLWLEEVRKDISQVLDSTNINLIMESMRKPFGDKVANETFTKLGERKKLLTETRKNRFDPKLGIVTTGAATIKPHKFYGSEG